MYCSEMLCARKLKRSTHIHTRDPEDVIEFLNCHYQRVTVGHLLEILKQSTHEAAEEPEPGPEEMTVTVWN